MREKLASAWVVPIVLAIIIACELLIWIIFGPLAALILVIIASQGGTGLLVLWLSKRQKRHSSQIEQSVERQAVRMGSAVRSLEEKLEETHRNLAETQALRYSADEEFRGILDLNTSEIRRISQLPTSLKPHPTDLRILDELADVRTGISLIHNQLSHLKHDHTEVREQGREIPDVDPTRAD